RDGLAERLALERVATALVERAAHDSGRAGGDPGPRAIEGLHRDLESFAFAADQVLAGELDLLEEHVGGVGGALSELVLLLADAHAGEVARDDEAGDALVPILGIAKPAEHRV